MRFPEEVIREAIREAKAAAERGEDPPLKCGQCMTLWKDHAYILLGSAKADSPERDLIDKLVADSRWDRLPFPTIDPQSERLVMFRGIRCPSGAGFLAPGEFLRSVYEGDR